MQETEIDVLVERHKGDSSAMVAILQDIQTSEGHLPRKALRRLSHRMGVPLSRLYALATFYRAFTLTPRGRHTVVVCSGTACHVRGAPRILAELERQLGVQAGQTTGDMQFTLETVNCLGACAIGPVMVVDGKYHGQMKPSGVSALLEQCRTGGKE